MISCRCIIDLFCIAIQSNINIIPFKKWNGHRLVACWWSNLICSRNLWNKLYTNCVESLCYHFRPLHAIAGEDGYCKQRLNVFLLKSLAYTYCFVTKIASILAYKSSYFGDTWCVHFKRECASNNMFSTAMKMQKETLTMLCILQWTL